MRKTRKPRGNARLSSRSMTSDPAEAEGLELSGRAYGSSSSVTKSAEGRGFRDGGGAGEEDGMNVM